jgi:O-antigen ligase
MRNAAAPGADPLLPIAAALAIAPLAVELQSKSLAPLATVALLATVLLHRRHRGAWPWPAGLAALAAGLLFLWGGISAAWAPQPGRALGTAIQLGGFVLLGAAAAQAVACGTEAARARVLRWAAAGLCLGLMAAAFDAATGQALRAAVRGLREASPGLVHGLKPAGSAMALWLPLVAAAPLPRALRGALILGGALVLLALPGESAKLAVLAAGLAATFALLLPGQAPRLLGMLLAGVIVLMPALLGPVLARGIPVGNWPPSAAHRLLIWDFTIDRITERPLLGWGLEASRSIPGHRDLPSAALLERFGLTGPEAARGWIPRAPMLPLHPHNGPLQLWLELGAVGAMLGGLLALLLAYRAGRSAAPAVALAMLASAAVSGMLSFGAWQEWWIGAELLALCGAAALARAPPRS